MLRGAIAAGGLKANGCVTTTVGPPQAVAPPIGAPPVGAVPARQPVARPTPAGPSPLEIKITPESAEAAVGGKVTFEIVVANHGPRPATGLVIKDRFDAGLDPDVPEAARNRSLSQPLGDIAPGGAHGPSRLPST